MIFNCVQISWENAVNAALKEKEQAELEAGELYIPRNQSLVSLSSEKM